jgi:hypothetical protein
MREVQKNLRLPCWRYFISKDKIGKDISFGKVSELKGLPVLKKGSGKGSGGKFPLKKYWELFY